MRILFYRIKQKFKRMFNRIFGPISKCFKKFFYAKNEKWMKSTFPKAYEYIQSDCYRYTGKSDFETIAQLRKERIAFKWQTLFRIVSEEDLKYYKSINKKFKKLNTALDYLSIPIGTKIGYGFYIGHGGPIIINPTAVIGDNVNVSQFTTIGSNEDHAAIIGNNVYIGPGCNIVEDVIIGDNVTIGAGSVVTKSIPENATAVGNYAKVINYNNPGRYVSNRWVHTED